MIVKFCTLNGLNREYKNSLLWILFFCSVALLLTVDALFTVALWNFIHNSATISKSLSSSQKQVGLPVDCLYCGQSNHSDME